MSRFDIRAGPFSEQRLVSGLVIVERSDIYNSQRMENVSKLKQTEAKHQAFTTQQCSVSNLLSLYNFSLTALFLNSKSSLLLLDQDRPGLQVYSHCASRDNAAVGASRNLRTVQFNLLLYFSSMSVSIQYLTCKVFGGACFLSSAKDQKWSPAGLPV